MKIPESNRLNASSPSSVSSLRSTSAPLSGNVRLPGPGLGETDAVNISTLSSRLSGLDSQSAAHESRLIELTGEVSSGRYHVDAYVLSDKLIQEHMRTAA